MTTSSNRSGMHIYYAGNKLSKWGKNPTSVETLGSLLQAHYPMILVSEKRRQLQRLIDMLLTFILNRRRIGLVLIDTYSTRAFYFAIALGLLARAYSIPYIPILRGGRLVERIGKNNRLSRSFFQRSHNLVAPSAFLHGIFSDNGYSNVITIPNTIRIADYAFIARTAFRPKLLWVRSLLDIYRPDIAIKVLAILKETYSDATLCMVGPDRDSLHSCLDLAKRLEVSDSVTFTGRLAKAKWHELAADYDIFLNTTSVDNTPVSVMEAMALGLPVVSTNVGGIPYLVEHGVNASLVSDIDPVKMAAEIQHIIENPDYARMISKNARTKVVSFDWDNVKEKWFSLLSSALR